MKRIDHHQKGSFMKNKASVLLLLSTSLLVSACTNPTLSNSASSPVSEGSSSSSKGALSSSSSSSNSASSSDLLTAEEAWKRAFALDYSNATSSYAESIHTAGEGNSDENIVTEYNFNGYNVIYDTESTSASNAYLYYHDYENKNYLYFGRYLPYYIVTAVYGFQKRMRLVFAPWVIIELLSMGADTVALLGIAAYFCGGWVAPL